jgi:DNA repair protein SbcC/Rad50
MKPIHLAISGLHSFRERQEIFFDRLSETGVFGIFGPTGSGKSSILDAMTLALYGTVGRAEHNTRGILNHAESQLSVSLTFQIGRDTHRKTYRVERSYKRKDELSVQNVRSRIIEKRADDEVVLADRDGEVTAYVKQILGLEPDDFTRAVVLPQGKFAEFLNLKGAERNKMLQRLFSLEQYGDALNERLKERIDRTQRQYERVAALQQGLGDASLAAVQQAEASLQLARQEELAAKEEVAERRLQFESAKQVWTLQSELLQIETSLEEHEKLSDTVSAMKVKLEQAKQAEKVIPHLEAYRNAVREHHLLSSQLAQMEGQITDLQVKLSTLEAKREEARQKRAVEEPRYLEKKAQLEAAKGLEHEVEALKRDLAQLKSEYDQQLAEYKALQSALQASEERLSQQRSLLRQAQLEMEANTVRIEDRTRLRLAKDALVALRNARDAYERASSECQTRALQYQEALGIKAQVEQQMASVLQEQAHIQSLVNEYAIYVPEKLEPILVLDAQLQQLGQLVSQWCTVEERRAEAARLRTEASETWRQAEQRLKETQQNYEALLRDVETKRQAYHASRLGTRQLALALAATLSDGEPCPVCGSPHHPNPAAPVDAEAEEAEVQSLENELNQLEQALQRISEERLEAERTFATRTAELDGHARAEAALQQEVSTVSSQVEAYCQNLEATFGMKPEGGFSPTAIVQWVEQERERLIHERESLQNGLLKREEVERKCSELERTRLQLQAELNGHMARVQTAKDEVERSEKALLEANQVLMSARRAFDEAVDQLAPADASEDSIDEAWVDQALLQMDEKDRRAEEARSLYERCSQAVQAAMEEKETAQSRLNDLQVSLTDIKARHQTTKTALEEKRHRLIELTGGERSDVAIAAVTKALEALRLAEQQAEQAVEQLKGKLSEIETERVRVQTRLESVAALKNANQEKFEMALQETGFRTPEEVERAVLSPEESQRFTMQIEEFEEKRKTLRIERDRLRNQLGERCLTEEEWKRVGDALEAAELRYRNAIGALDVAMNKLEALKARHAQWKALEADRERLSSELSRLGVLKSLLSGNKFVEFVAGEQLDFVARLASERLKQLTRNRYALEVSSDGRFMMRDDHNGGVRRPVSTLSGGETFLTSLALALSLSTQIQLRGKYPLEFFFLDEGFGTLDPELLDVVMSTLEKLQSEQMTIGIISHVPELRSRMQRRLIVEPAEPAGRGTRVRLELA